MVNGSRLAVPGQVGIQFQLLPGPNVHPGQATIGNQGQVSTIIFGGQTRLEAVAAQVLSALIMKPPSETADESCPPMSMDDNVHAAVAYARKLIAACDAEQSSPAKVTDQ